LELGAPRRAAVPPSPLDDFTCMELRVVVKMLAGPSSTPFSPLSRSGSLAGASSDVPCRPSPSCAFLRSPSRPTEHPDEFTAPLSSSPSKPEPNPSPNGRFQLSPAMRRRRSSPPAAQRRHRSARSSLCRSIPIRRSTLDPIQVNRADTGQLWPICKRVLPFSFIQPAVRVR